MFLNHLDCLNLAHWLHNTVSEDGLSPVCFAIVDSSGDLIWFERMDQAPVQAIPLSISKAYTAARLSLTTTDFHNQLQQEQLRAQDYMDAQLTAVPGGTPLVNSDNRLIGAIGISGRDSRSDQMLADAVAMYYQTF